MTDQRLLVPGFMLTLLLFACTSGPGEQAQDQSGGATDSREASVTDTSAEPAVLPDLGEAAAPRAFTVEVVERLPHDEAAFTQGLVYADGRLYESTGRYGESDVRLVEPATGDVLLSTPLPDRFFGEGLAMHDGRLFQLTWQEQQLHVWDGRTLREVGRLTYQGEGWGLTGDGESLWRSDGSSILHRHDPETFEVIGTVEVSDRGVSLARLNELELVDGHILANVFTASWIAVIEPETGQVVGWVDATPLMAEVDASDLNEVLNGIAVDPVTGRLWLTGKRWPTLFEVRIVAGDDLPPPGLRQ